LLNALQDVNLEKIQCYVLIILNYISLHSYKHCGKIYKKFKFFLITLFSRSNQLEGSIREVLFSNWINLTCKLPVKIVSSLVKEETNFV